ncbi:survival factor 1 [Kwoniella heveanensis CBS 569]|nr:survival factor 1 [Kwoniella heveanensis CBS 569]
MSWFSSSSSSSAGTGPNFFPVTSSQSGFGELSPADTAWANTSNKGFQTETQIWYSVLKDGSFLMVQIIWSYLGVFLVPATTQMTFKVYNPKTKKSTWRSINASGAKFDRQNLKSDQFEIKHTGSPTTEEVYTITATLDKTVHFSLTFTRPADAPGFKLGSGPQGGISTFGKEQDESKRDGFVVHRFHPLSYSSGTITVDGETINGDGDGMFVHAIQGMRPNLVASRWNFAFFTTAGGEEDAKLGGVRAIQMEFETTDDYGPKGAKSGRTKANIGCVYTTKSAPLIVTGQTHSPAQNPTAYPNPSGDVSSAVHSAPILDKETGYPVPSAISFNWESNRINGEGRVSAKVELGKAGALVGEGGLIEKVDVLAEIPYVIRKGLAAVTGTKPYIYQYHNPATLELSIDGETIPVKGWLFNEASFVSQ